LAGWLVFSISCDNPTESKSNPYEQHAIEWPSLADSPWPMYHGSPIGTGLALYKGSVNMLVDWNFEAYQIGTGIVVDSLGNSYFTNTLGFLFKIDKEGSLIWSTQLVNDYIDEPGTPILLKSGEIFVHLGTKAFILSDSGGVKKSFNLPDVVDLPSFQIDKEGGLYAVTRLGRLFKISQSGELEWVILPPDSLDEEFYCSTYEPVFLPDGENLIVGANDHLYSIDREGNIVWYRTIKTYSQITISPEGTIYIFNHEDSTLNCLNGSGNILWSKKLPFVLDGFSRATITKDGEIVFPVAIGQNTEAGVAKFSSRGDLIWRIELRREDISALKLLVTSMNIYCSTTLGPMYVISSVERLLPKLVVDGSRDVTGDISGVFDFW
jgi:hypothetical protein